MLVTLRRKEPSATVGGKAKRHKRWCASSQRGIFVWNLGCINCMSKKSVQENTSQVPKLHARDTAGGGHFTPVVWLFLVISPQGTTDSALKGTFFILPSNREMALCATHLCFYLNISFSMMTCIYFVRGPALLRAQVQVWGRRTAAPLGGSGGRNSAHQV